MVYNKVKFGKHTLVKKWLEGQKVSKIYKNDYFLNFLLGTLVPQCMVLGLKIRRIE